MTDLADNNNYFAKLMNKPLTCLGKWRWSSIHLQMGYSRSCYRTDEDHFTEDTVEQFHNLPLQLETRQQMLDGKWPGRGCEYCKKLEEVGAISNRLQYNHASYKGNVPKELLTNNRAVKVTPTLIEISLGNLCNMSCIYCGPTYSSIWEAEMIKQPDDELREPEKLFDKATYHRVVDKFFLWLDSNIGDLRDIHLLGGEPTLQPELLRLITLLETNPNVQLDSFVVVTNLKLPRAKLAMIANRLEKLIDSARIKEVVISASLDCWGPQQEYIRTGLNLAQFEDNLAYLVLNHPRMFIDIHGTITALTIKTMPKLMERINYYNSMREGIKVTFTCNFLSRYEYLHPESFPAGFYDQDFDEIYAELGKIEDQRARDTLIEVMQGYQRFINVRPYNPAAITQMKAVLDKLDKRRGTSWRPLFPWIADFDETTYRE